MKTNKTPAERLEKERARYQAEKERIKGVTAAYREANRELLKEKGTGISSGQSGRHQTAKSAAVFGDQRRLQRT